MKIEEFLTLSNNDKTFFLVGMMAEVFNYTYAYVFEYCLEKLSVKNHSFRKLFYNECLKNKKKYVKHNSEYVPVLNINEVIDIFEDKVERIYYVFKYSISDKLIQDKISSSWILFESNFLKIMKRKFYHKEISLFPLKLSILVENNISTNKKWLYFFEIYFHKLRNKTIHNTNTKTLGKIEDKLQFTTSKDLSKIKLNFFYINNILRELIETIEEKFKNILNITISFVNNLVSYFEFSPGLFYLDDKKSLSIIEKLSTSQKNDWINKKIIVESK